MRCRLDAVEIERLDPLDVLEDVRQLGLHAGPFLVTQIETGEAGNVVDGGAIQGHGLILVGTFARKALVVSGVACYRLVMTSTKDLLADHESLIFDLRPHWIELAGAVLWAIVIIAGAVVGARYAHHWKIWAIAAVILLLWFSGRPIVRWAFTRFILTTDRIITRHGMIAKRSREIPLERVNDVTFSQSVFQRVLGAGDIVLESAGERGQEVIGNVRHPQKVHLRIYEEMENNSNRTYGGGRAAAPAPAAPDVTDQIAALAKLKDQGAISEAEYESKKAELLKRL